MKEFNQRSKPLFKLIYPLCLIFISILFYFWGVMYYIGYLGAFNVVSPETQFPLASIISAFSALLATSEFGPRVNHWLSVLLWIFCPVFLFTVIIEIFSSKTISAINNLFLSHKKVASTILTSLFLLALLPFMLICIIAGTALAVEASGFITGNHDGLDRKETLIKESVSCDSKNPLETIHYVKDGKQEESTCSIFVFQGNDHKLYLRKHTMLLIAQPNILVSSWNI